MLFGLRFDFRNPAFAGTTMADRYAAALDIAEWADGLGCVRITVSEHHGSPDGYLPSPVPMLAAMAARTTNVRFLIAALIAPFHDPLRLAEDMVVLDNLSRGRVDLVVAGGYVRDEFAMFDVPMNERAKRVTDVVTTLKAAFTGEPFDYRGRVVRVTPAPFRPGGPAILLGGSSEPAARRAARIADGFVPSVPEVWDFYRDEVMQLGRPDPGPGLIGPNRVVALAEDPDQGWEQMAPFFLHETNAYGGLLAENDGDAGRSTPSTMPTSCGRRVSTACSRPNSSSPSRRRHRSRSRCSTRSVAGCRSIWRGRACASSSTRCYRRSRDRRASFERTADQRSELDQPGGGALGEERTTDLGRQGAGRAEQRVDHHRSLEEQVEGVLGREADACEHLLRLRRCHPRRLTRERLGERGREVAGNADGGISDRRRRLDRDERLGELVSHRLE